MRSLKDKTVTVFGGTGFIGRYIVPRLARLGARIVIPTRDPDKALPLKTAGDVGQIVPFQGNIKNPQFVRDALQGAVAAINLIGILTESWNARFDRVMGNFPGELAEIAARAGVKRLVHISAIGADSEGEAHYARAKGRGEEGVFRNFPDATILRPSLVIGPEDDFFNRFASLMLFSPALPLIGGGKTKFQAVYVGDVADAAVVALTADTAAGKIYELGGPAVFTFRQLMELLLKETGRKRLLLPLPFWAATIDALILQFAPGPLKLTPDQVTLLKKDNILSGDFPGLRDLDITPTAIETVLPAYLDKYREGGRFAA